MSDDALKAFNAHVGPVIGVRLEHIIQKETPPPEENADLEEHQKRNAAFIKEAHEVILGRAVRAEEFNRWMNALNQGASYEGIFNGLSLGDEYRSKEVGVAPPDSLRMYARIMTRLTLDAQYESKKFDDAGDGDRKSAVIPPAPTKEQENKLLSEFARKGVNKPLFVLKRECAQEALKVMDLKKSYREKLATWYGHFAAFTNEFKVDFGIADRNVANDVTHYRWALSASEDRIKWEIFNRIHRLFPPGTEAK